MKLWCRLFKRTRGSVETKKIVRILEFKLGSYIELSATNLAEICLFIDETATELAAGAVDFAKRIRIEVRERENEN